MNGESSPASIAKASVPPTGASPSHEITAASPPPVLASPLAQVSASDTNQEVNVFDEFESRCSFSDRWSRKRGRTLLIPFDCIVELGCASFYRLMELLQQQHQWVCSCYFC